jgi:CheY-like chemotaxis protein
VSGDGAARDQPSPAARTASGGRSVLIVDDDPFIRKLVATTLEDVAGFDLVEASDGIEAVEIARIHSPAIIFLDVNMPRLDGIGAAAQLRALPGAEATTIVMLTAAGPERERAARDAGADLFLTKPFSPLDLLRLVDEIGGAAGY